MFGLSGKISNIVAGAAGGLLIAAAIWIMLLNGAIGRRDTRINLLVEQVKNEQLAHAVTRQSVQTLEAALADKNAESLARAKAFEDAKRKGEADLAALNARYAAGESRRSSLEAILRNPPSAVCRVPDGLLDGLGGL